VDPQQQSAFSQSVLVGRQSLAAAVERDGATEIAGKAPASLERR
jgi:hypothetical protein